VEGSELTGKNEFHRVCYHKLGSPQESDRLVYENPANPQRLYNVSVTEDEAHIILYEQESSSGNAFYYKKAEDKEGAFQPIITHFDNINGVIDHIDGKLLVLTNIDAPKKRLVLVDPAAPATENWLDLIPEKEEVLQGVYLYGGHIFATYMKDATSRVYIYGMDGQYVKELNLPGLGSLGSLNGQRTSDEVFFSFTSFTFPNTIYRYDIASGETVLFKEAGIDFDSDAYETKQVFYTSKDGTKVPMFIVHKKGLQMDGSNPTMLYGYGGFNVSLTPSFSVSRLVFLENGGVFAMPNIRGGGEYGEQWHKAGTKLQKQNVFDDFIAAAEYLISEGYTSPEKLAMHGGSNGGLLVGAIMTQRPELMKVALPAVGVMDMLRFHKFTIGWAWTGDYGSSENEEEFHYLKGYSPLHNLKAGTCYPATLITTADHDDRVVPAHSFKFAATLQEMHACENPVLIRIETKAGHGAGKPTAKRIEEAADMYAFMMYNLGMKL
jgi:prolyl oligopeptidase